MAILEITAKGHHNIKAIHRTTWQLTTEDHLTPQGDCIIGISASHSAATLPFWLKDHLQSGGEIFTTIEVGEHRIEGTAYGHPDLILSDPHDMVFRKSEFLSDRTVAIGSTIVARDLNNEMISLLQDGAVLKVTIKVD